LPLAVSSAKTVEPAPLVLGGYRAWTRFFDFAPLSLCFKVQKQSRNDSKIKRRRTIYAAAATQKLAIFILKNRTSENVTN
jgi:hypothetical protein